MVEDGDIDAESAPVAVADTVVAGVYDQIQVADLL